MSAAGLFLCGGGDLRGVPLGNAGGHVLLLFKGSNDGCLQTLALRLRRARVVLRELSHRVALNQSQEGRRYILRVRTNRKRGGGIYSA
eukprot:1182539-Prorocentrum_minimum.AAC.3